MNAWKLYKYLGVVYFFILGLGCVGIITTAMLVEYGHKPEAFIGCYVYDALVISIKCKGFVFADVAEFVLNLPLLMFFAPLLAPYSLHIALIAVFLWFFPIMYVISILKLRDQ